jgi:small subunit ribosomal protein S27e
MPGKFVKVKCEKCKNEQVIFEKSASVVRCLVCGEVLAEPSGGRAVIKSKVLGTAK